MLAKGKYPYSKALIKLLVRYVQLEYDVLYHPENYSVKYEKEVEVKVHFFLHLLLDGVVRKFRKENVQHYDSTATECVLRIFNQVNGEYKIKGRFIWSAINKLAKKLGLLETISEIRQNGVLLSQNHPTFTKLSCDNIEDISDCDSEYEIPLSPARSCESPVDNLKLEYPVKREPPDLDSGQDIEQLRIHDDFGSGTGYDDDSDNDSVISDGKLQRLLDVKCEIQDYNSDSDDCVIDLKSEREHSKSVQITGDNYDNKCSNLTDVAIKSTNGFAKCEQKLNKNGDRGETSNCENSNNNDSSVNNNKRDDFIIGDSHSNNSNVNNKNSNGDISKAPSNAGNSSQVIELDDEDDEDDLIIVTKSAKQIKTSPHKVKSPVIVLDSDDENDCVIVNNDEEKIPKCDDKSRKIRSFSDNQVNEISSTTGSNITSKNKEFETYTSDNTSNNYRRMNRSSSSEVHALEDLTPEGVDEKCVANQENALNRDEFIGDILVVKEEDAKDPKDKATTSRIDETQTPHPNKEIAVKAVTLTERTTTSQDQTPTDTTNNERTFRTSNELLNEMRYRCPIYDDEMPCRSYDLKPIKLMKDHRVAKVDRCENSTATNYTNGYKFGVCATSSIRRDQEHVEFCTRSFVSETKVIIHQNNVTSLRHDIHGDVPVTSKENAAEGVNFSNADSGLSPDNFQLENLIGDNAVVNDKNQEDGLNSAENANKTQITTEPVAQLQSVGMPELSLDETPKMPSETPLFNYFSNTSPDDLTSVELTSHEKQRRRYFDTELPEGKVVENLQLAIHGPDAVEESDSVEETCTKIDENRTSASETSSDGSFTKYFLDTTPLGELADENFSNPCNTVSEVPTKVLDMTSNDAKSSLCEEPRQRYFEKIFEVSQEQNSQQIGEKFQNLKSLPAPVTGKMEQEKEAIKDTLEQSDSVHDVQSLDESYSKTKEQHTSISKASLDRYFAKYFSNTAPLGELADETPKEVLDMSDKDVEPLLHKEQRQRYFEAVLETPQEQNLDKESEQTGEKMLPTPVRADIKQEKEAITGTSEQSDSVNESLDQSYTKPNKQHTSISKASLDRSFAKYLSNTAPLRKLADETPKTQCNTISEAPKKVLDMSSKDTEPSLHEEQRQRYFEAVLETPQEQNLHKESEQTGDKSLPPPVRADTDTSEQSDSVDEFLDQSYTKTKEQHISTSKASLDRYFAKYFSNTAPLGDLADENPTNQSNTISEAPKEVLDKTSKDTLPSLYKEQRRRYFDEILEAPQEQNLHKESKQTGEKFHSLKSLPPHLAADIEQQKEVITDTSDSVDDVQSLDEPYAKTNEQQTSTFKVSLDRSFAKYLSNTAPLRELADENLTNQCNTISAGPKKVWDISFDGALQEQHLHKESEHTGEKFQYLKSLSSPITVIKQAKEAITDTSEQSDSVDESSDQSYTKTTEQHTSRSKAKAKYLSNTAPLRDLTDENPTNQSNAISEVLKKVSNMSNKDTEPSLHEQQQRYFERILETAQEQNLHKESEQTGNKSLPAPVRADIKQEREVIADTSEQSYTKTNEQHTSTSKASLDRYFAKYFSNTAPLGDLADENPTNQSNTISEDPKQVLHRTSKDTQPSLYEEQRQRYLEGAPQEQNLHKESEQTEEKFQYLKSLQAPVTTDVKQPKEAITETSEQSDSVNEFYQSYTKIKEQHTSTSKASVDQYFAKYFSKTAPLKELADENPTTQCNTISENPKKVLDMSGKDADQRQKHFDRIFDVPQEQNLHQESEQTEEKFQNLKSQPAPPVTGDIKQQKEVTSDTLKKSDSVDDIESLDEICTKTNEQHTSKSKASLDRSFAKYLSNTAPLGELADENSTNQSNTISEVPKKVLDMSGKDAEPPLYEEQRQRYFEQISEAHQNEEMGQTAEKFQYLKSLPTPPVTADIEQQKSDSVDDMESLDESCTKTNKQHTSKSKASVDRSFAKYLSNTTPLGELADENSTNQSNRISEAPNHQHLDMGGKDVEPSLYDEERQRYFEVVLEAPQEQNLHKESEQTVEHVQDVKLQPDHIGADMEVGVRDTSKQPEFVEDTQPLDESHTKNNEQLGLDRSFSKYLSPLREISDESPLNRSNTVSKPPTKTLDMSRKYIEPPSFEEQRQRYFERTIDTSQEQNLRKDSEQTAIHDAVPNISDRNTSRSTSKLDRSFAKYCSDVTPLREPKDPVPLNKCKEVLNKSSKYAEPPSFEEQRQKYFEQMLETEENVNTEVSERPSSIFTEAILAEASAEEGLSKGVADEDGADLEKSIQPDHQHDNEEQLPAPNQQESIDSAATELEELLALSTADVKHEASSGNRVKIGKNQCVNTLSSELEQALELSQTDCCRESMTTTENDEAPEVTRDESEAAGLDTTSCDNTEETDPVQDDLPPSPSGDKSETSVVDQNVVNEEICNENFINSLAGEDIEEIYLVVPGEAVSGEKTGENEDEDVVFVLDPSMCNDEAGEYSGIEDELIRINFLIEEDEVPEDSEPTPNTADVEYRFNGSDIPTVDEEICVDHSENQVQYSDEVTPENGDLVFLSNQDYISEAVHEVQTTQSTHDDASQHDKEDEIQPIIEDSEVIIEATESSIEASDQIQPEAEITQVQTQVDDLVPQEDAEYINSEAMLEIASQPEVVSNPQDNQELAVPDEVVQDEARTSEVTETSIGQIENVEHEAINDEVAVEGVSEVTNDEIVQETTTTDHVSVDEVILTNESENNENHEVPITQSEFDDFTSRHEVSQQIPVDLSKQNEGVGCGTEEVVPDDHVLTQTNSVVAIAGAEDQHQVDLSAIEATKANFKCIKLEIPSEETNQIDFGKDEFPENKLKMDCVKNEIFVDAKTVMNMHDVNIVPHYVNANFADIHMKYIKDEVITRSQCITKEEMQDFVKAQITDFSDKCQILYPSVAIQHDTPRAMSLSTLSSKFAESLAEKTEDIYYENLDILATAAAAQKSLKIEGAPKAKRSRIKMAAFNKSKAAKFKPNEVRETLRPQPANTIDATILAESDFNGASEDSCDSYGGKLIIAEEEHISNIDETVFDEDTVDEKIIFVPTKLEDVEDTEIRICITDSEKYERAFNELELLEMVDVIEDDGFKSSPKRGRRKMLKNNAENNLDKEVLLPESSPIDYSFKPIVKNSVKKPRRKSPKKVAKIENNVVEAKSKIETDDVVKDETKAKDEVGLGFDRFLMGESLMLTHDGEFVKVHTNASGTKPKLIPANPDKLAEEINTVNDVNAIKQPIRTKAALKSYDKKNNLNLAENIEDKFKLRPYVKLVTDPTIQKMIDNLPDSTKSATMPKISLGRKNYRSLLDARKLLHRTSVIQNHKLKIENVPKIGDPGLQKTAPIEELKKPPPIPKAGSPVRRFSLDTDQAKGVSAEIKPVEAKLSNKVQAVPKYRKISRSISLIDSKSNSLPNLSTSIDTKLNKSDKTGSGSNLINGVKPATSFNKKSNCNGLQIKNNISKQDDLNLKQTLSKLSQFGTTFEEIKIEREIKKAQTIKDKDDVKKVDKSKKGVQLNSENKNTSSSQKMKAVRKILDRRKTDESFLKKKTNMKPKEEELVSKLKTRRLSVDVELISFDKCKTNHFTKIAKETHTKNEVERSKLKPKEDSHPPSVKRKHQNHLDNSECIRSNKSNVKKSKISPDHDITTSKQDQVDKVEPEKSDKHITGERKHQNDLDNSECIQSNKSDVKKSKISPDHDITTIKHDKVNKVKPEEADEHIIGEKKHQNEIIKDGDNLECIQNNKSDIKPPKITPNYDTTMIKQDEVDKVEPVEFPKKPDQEVVESISEILNEIVRKIEEEGNAMIEVGTEININQDETVPTPQENLDERDMETKTEPEEIEPKCDQINENIDSEQLETKIAEENLDQNKLEVTPIKTLKELATECLNANPVDATQQKILEQDEISPKTVENESEVAPTQPPIIELEKIQDVGDLDENSESLASIAEQKLDIKENEDQIMEGSKEVVANLIEKVVAKLRKENIPELLNLTKLTPKGVSTSSTQNNVAAKSYTRKPIIKKRHNDLKQSLQKEVPFQYIPKKKRVTFNAKEIILNAAEFDANHKIVTSTENPTNTELNQLNIEGNNVKATTSPKILNFEQNKLERNQIDQKIKEQTITSPTKRRDRKNIDEVINILRSNLEEKIEITIVQVIDDEKPNETVEDLKKITEDNQKTRLFQPWQDMKTYQPKIEDKSEENDIPSEENSPKDIVEDVSVKEIEKSEEKHEDVEGPSPAPAETLDLTSLEETEPETIATEALEIPPEAIEPETTDQEVIDVKPNTDEIPDTPVSNPDVPIAEVPSPLVIKKDFENFAENIFSTSTPLRLIQREYSFISEEDAEPKNDEEELIVKDELIKADEIKEIITEEDNFDDKQMPNLSPIVDTNDNSSSTTEEDDKEMMKLTTDSQLTPPPILEKEVPTPIGTNFATSALLDNADDVMSSVLENIPGQEKTFNFASEESLFDDSSKTSDMLLNFNENQFMNEKDQDLNITAPFPEITDKSIDISYDATPTPTPIDKPSDTNHSTISDIMPSNVEPNEMSWPPVSTSESFLKNHDFVEDTIPEDSPVKTEALNMIYTKPTTPERIDKKSMEIKNESIHKTENHQRFTDNLAAIPSTSKMCESSHLSAITTQMSSFGTDQVLTTRSSDLHSAVNFGTELGVNSENPNSMFGKDFDTIDEDDTPIIEKVKAYGTMHIGSGTNSDHNYSMGGPFLGGEYESSELSTKQLAQENDQKGSSNEDFGNTGIEGDSMFPFSAQVCISFIENNLTQETNRSLNHSPVDGGTDYHLPEQDGQLPFSFADNQDATQQLQDSQNTIKILNQECDSRQEDNITSFREDFSNPMSVENMNIDRISFTAATVQSHDNQNHLLKASEREKVTVIYNEHDFASTNSIKEITCLETPQLSKDDLIRSSIKHEALSTTRQRRQSPEKVGGRSPKKNKKCKERDAPLSNFSSAMTAKAMADIARKKIENKRERVDYGYIRQNTKTQVLAPVKKISPNPTPDRKSPQQTKSNSSSPVRNEIINTDAEIVPSNEKVEPASKPEEALPILVEKPKDHKEIAQEKLRDLLSTISINNKFDTVKLRRRQPPERLSDTLAMEMLVKDTKNQLKQFSRPPTSPKQYSRSQTKPKKAIKLDKPGGKLVDYDDSSLSDEPPAKFYEKIKKDKSEYPSKRYSDISDDDFVNKPKRTPTKTDLNRADDPSFYRLNNGEHAPKRPGDNSDLDFPARSKIPRTQAEMDRAFDALKMLEDANKIARKKEDAKNANQDFNLTPRWAASSSNNYHDPKKRIPPPQPRHDQRLYQNKSRSAIILNSQYNSQNTPYKRYQATTSQNPPNPRNLCSNSRLPPGGKHANGADGNAARAASHNSRPAVLNLLGPTTPFLGQIFSFSFHWDTKGMQALKLVVQELEEPIYRIKLEDDCTMSQTETSENQNHSDSSVTKPDEKENEVSKLQFRKKVWEYLEKNKLTNFPRPVYWRIPNFKGSEQAAAKLLELDEFKTVKYIEVNADKPQEAARILVLENQKNLYVPVPRLKDGLLKYITIPEEYNGQTIGINDEIQIDLLVLGSVAVSKEGYRIGKGRGYADLEFAILLEMGAVSDKTIVVTTVHDSQVFDTLPHEIFKDYDVPVDYILTPTQIIKIEKRLPRPTGIIWNILSQRRLNLMPVLKALKDIHDGKGKDTTLKDTDTDVEANEPRRRFPNRIKRLRRRRPRTDTKNSESQGEEASNNENVPQQRNYRRRKFFHRRKVARQQEKPSENGDTSVGENGQNAPKPPPPPRRNNRFPPFRRNLRQIDFSLMVSNIEKNVRVRDLKNALIERGIKPNVITWRGYKGICYLHYAKSNAKSVKLEKSPIVVDNVIEILQNLKISPDSETNLSVKIMEPVSRTVNVTTV
ncbi:5-formyltetrahydrofolate cyclo-ligase-related [Holotrichia oblita]|uniref:5-formyltetrahydrofolate cyclo-ligase-related n=1 Tax=Holotrichia oblita TaxID=644536 RepID=A0ACB9TRU4_HOLOL|nr:5-formyltetrahydrofolate cyclo-ligase-related [Holotrichia oblita]